MADLAVAENRLGAALWRWRLFAFVAEALAAEGDRRILWLPVFFGSGIAVYFTPTFEPPWWVGLAGTIAAIIPVLVLRHRPALRNAALALAFCAAGLAIMQQARWDCARERIELFGLVSKSGGFPSVPAEWRAGSSGPVCPRFAQSGANSGANFSGGDGWRP